MSHFAEVILPLALPQNYTYRIPPFLQDQVSSGKRVIVQFGKRKLYTALVRKVHAQSPRGFTPKDIISVEDKLPIVSELQMQFWEWMANYYLCSQGEVMTAALPSGLKLESEMTILRNQLKRIDDEELNDHEYLVVEALEVQDKLSIKEISDIIGLANPLPIIKDLLGKHYIFLEEEIKNAYQPVKKRMVKLAEGVKEEQLNKIFEELSRAPKQRELLLQFFTIKSKDEQLTAARLLKKAHASDSALKALADKGYLEIYYDSEDKYSPSAEAQNLKQLNPDQEKALAEIRQHWEKQPVCLLHGVTSSGKTEIYSRLIKEQLDQGNKVLYLVPEIALTTQLIARLKKHFEEQVVVYHSRFSDRERVESWLDLAQVDDKPTLIVGARSSLFLPMQNLKLVIVDEEHESSFKQYDPAPRYHARDSAIVLAHMHKAKVLLGSATPSLESYYNAESGKYGLVSLLKRFGDMPLPEITCVDLKESRRKKRMRGHFSEYLQTAIEETMKEGKQVILFQNRRGFSTFIQCQTCGHVMECKNCDISLTYHKYSDQLRCHYCGYSRNVPKRCPACSSHEVRSLGFGTEKIEDDLKLMFPEINVQRMDLDTTRRKNAYENIIAAFEEGQTDILVGTQMVTKGLDFENVGLVGIMNADTLLNFPDFRSHERAFQLLAQVAGRAGRKGKRGKVIVQTSEPYHNVIRKVMDNQYLEFYKEQLYERKNFHYPPLYRLIRLTLKHRDKAHLQSRANILAQSLRAVFGDRLLGPEFPLTARLRNLYQMEMLLKLEASASRPKAKALLRECVEDFEQKHPDRKVQIIYDVDPY